MKDKTKLFYSYVRSKQKVKPVIPQYQSVDEIMVAFKGKSLLRQFLPAKPHKWGFKLWGRCGVSGFMYDFDLYQGKEPTERNASEFGMSGNVVLKLVSTLAPNRNFKISADNYFTSIPLVEKLKGDGFLSTGTIRPNRLKGCPLLSEKELKKNGRGSVDHHLRNGSITAVRWYDNRAVNLVSSFVGCEPLDMVKRYDRKIHAYIEVPRPNIVKTYNMYMGGVDKLDMLCALYKPTVKSRRWYLYIWLHTIIMAVSNAWLLYRRHQKELHGTSKTMPLRIFQAKIASGLVAAGKHMRGRPSLEAQAPPKKKRKVQGHPDDNARKDGLDHQPLWEKKRQRCALCPGKAAFSYVKCSKCNVWLCLNKDRNCFVAYHR